MTNNQPQTHSDQPSHHEQFHDVMEAAHQARAQAIREGFSAVIRAASHAFKA